MTTFTENSTVHNAIALIVSFGAVAFGFKGLTIFAETPWLDVSIGRYGFHLLKHDRR